MFRCKSNLTWSNRYKNLSIATSISICMWIISFHKYSWRSSDVVCVCMYMCIYMCMHMCVCVFVCEIYSLTVCRYTHRHSYFRFESTISQHTHSQSRACVTNESAPPTAPWPDGLPRAQPFYTLHKRFLFFLSPREKSEIQLN